MFKMNNRINVIVGCPAVNRANLIKFKQTWIWTKRCQPALFGCFSNHFSIKRHISKTSMRLYSVKLSRVPVSTINNPTYILFTFNLMWIISDPLQTKLPYKSMCVLTLLHRLSVFELIWVFFMLPATWEFIFHNLTKPQIVVVDGNKFTAMLTKIVYKRNRIHNAAWFSEII